MPFIAVKNLHQRTILEVLFLLVHFYTMMCELSEQTAVRTITHISHNSAQVSLSFFSRSHFQCQAAQKQMKTRSWSDMDHARRLLQDSPATKS